MTEPRGLRFAAGRAVHSATRLLSSLSLTPPRLARGPSDGTPEERHLAKVRRVAEQLRRHDTTRPVSFQKASVSHRVPKPNDARYTDDKIDVSDMNEILEIDVAARTCTAEPGVTFTDLVRRTMVHGLVPIIVPELRTITIGGAVAGCSVESMSFRHGGFHDTCLEYEVVTANGEVLTCTPDNEHALVFQMMHGTFGTLGLLSKLTFKLVPCRPYVHVRYEPYRKTEDYLAAIFRHYEGSEDDFMDGILHAGGPLVVNVGRFVDEAPYTNRYDWMKVYYESTRQRSEDFLRVPDYYFRYDNGVTNVHPKSPIARFLFGKFFHSSELLRLAETFHYLLPASQPEVTLDMMIPFSKAGEFLRWYRETIGEHPLWCVPYRIARRYEWVSPRMFEGINDELYLDLAIYGLEQPPGRNYYAELEKKLFELQAVKTLIAYNYYDEKTFWSVWNEPNYRAVKKITDPRNVFRDLYVKTCLSSQGRTAAT